MKTLGLMVAVAMLVVGMAPLVAGQEEATGSATGGNLTPEVTSVTAPSPVAPLVEVNFSCTVQDNNTLADITTVELIVYLTSTGEVASDDVKNHYTFQYTAPETWEEIGPDPDGDSHIVAGSCTKPTDLTLASGDYVFAIILSGAATAGEWTAKWTATDDNEASGDNTDTFTVNEYILLAIDPTTQTFSGDPGDMGETATEGLITCTVTANTNFDIETKLLADWIGTAHSQAIGAENTHAEGGVSIDLTTDYADVWTNVTFDEGVEKTITYTLDLPNPLRDDVYTATIYINAKKYTA